jgi:hypothetical protein
MASGGRPGLPRRSRPPAGLPSLPGPVAKPRAEEEDLLLSSPLLYCAAAQPVAALERRQSRNASDGPDPARFGPWHGLGAGVSPWPPG